MNYVKEKARFETAEAEKAFKTAIANANTEAEVNKVTESTVTFVEKFA